MLSSFVDYSLSNLLDTKLQYSIDSSIDINKGELCSRYSLVKGIDIPILSRTMQQYLPISIIPSHWRLTMDIDRYRSARVDISARYSYYYFSQIFTDNKNIDKKLDIKIAKILKERDIEDMHYLIEYAHIFNDLDVKRFIDIRLPRYITGSFNLVLDYGYSTTTSKNIDSILQNIKAYKAISLLSVISIKIFAHFMISVEFGVIFSPKAAYTMGLRIHKN